MMKRFRSIALVTVMGLMSCALTAHAEHTKIDLRVIAPNDEQVSYSDQEPPEGGILPRPLIKVRTGDPLVLQFILTNIYPHGELKDVVVHYFIARAERAGDKIVPDLKNGVVTEGQFTMNFKPRCRVGARLQVTAPEPGFYLVRVETKNTKSDHEHFSAIELQVE